MFLIYKPKLTLTVLSTGKNLRMEYLISRIKTVVVRLRHIHTRQQYKRSCLLYTEWGKKK